MKLHVRILAPAIAALALAALFLLFLWWQLLQATTRVGEEARRVVPRGEDFPSPLGTEGPIDASDRALLHVRQGDLLALQGEWAEAQEEYERAVDAGGSLVALRKLAQAQLQRRDLEGARATIRALRQEGARAEDLLLLESIVALRTGELVRAREILEGAAADSPQKHYGLALLAIVQGSHAAAKQDLQTVLGGWDPVLRTYARTLLAAYDEYALFPGSPEIHLVTLLSRALAQVQECELALPLLVQVLQEQDDYRDAWIVQGTCELVTERTEGALASFERAYALDPEKPEIQYFLARTYAELGDHRNAITFLQYALTNGFEPEIEVRKLLAREAVEAGDSALELAQYEALLGMENTDLTIFEKYITLTITLGKNAEAYSVARTASEKFPSEAKAWELLGWASDVSNRKDEARSALGKALELDPSLQSARDRLEKL